jgi:indolepyruvate ferredoxin oxidoreductase alpha subunit
MQQVLSGNEAIARGAWEAGVKVATAYPGTPSTEILENMSTYPDVYSEWSTNEKVALEVAIGASSVHARALCAMKLVGLNVAADPLFNASYVGVRGGLVVVSADDPGRHSSQTEQDNRNYGKFAKIPVLEPSNSQECKDFMILAFALSEELNTPILFRTTTRTSHSKGLVQLSERTEAEAPLELHHDMRYSLLPAFTRTRPMEVREREVRIKERSETLDINRIEMGDPAVGIVACGAAYQYAREAFPTASFLKIGMPWPLPVKLAAEFRAKVAKLYVVEELDPFMEEQLRLAGITIDGGQELTPRYGELDPFIVANRLHAAGVPGATQTLLSKPDAPVEGLPVRPPTLCPGCGHRGVFTVLSRLKTFVSGDIGCYTLGAMPPFNAMNSDICMGASVSTAHGIQKALGELGADKANRKVSVIGDSTFFHSGITGLLDIVWNGGTSVIIILDNRTTAMTGGQDTPGTGKTLSGKDAPWVDIAAFCRAIGVPRVEVVDPYDLKEVERSIKEALDAHEASVIVAKAPCVLQYKIRGEYWVVDEDACTGCKRCLRVGCTALSLLPVPEGEEKAKVAIDPSLCTGCGVCAQMCRFDAIGPRVAAPVGA